MHPSLVWQEVNFSEAWVDRPVRILVILVVALLTRWLLRRLIDRLVRRADHPALPERLGRVTVSKIPLVEQLTTGPDSGRRLQRAKAIGGVLKSVCSVIVWAVAGTMILSTFGFDIAPILASAGIVGIALGLGAQTIVRDLLAGISMIFEDQFAIGDFVDLGPAQGTIEAISLRVTQLRDAEGTVWYVRNGEVLRVGNLSQNWSRIAVDVLVDPRADLVAVRGVLSEVCDSLWRDDEFRQLLVEEPELVGVEAMTGSAVTVRITVKTAPGQQQAVARVLRERITIRLAHEDIALGAA